VKKETVTKNRPGASMTAKHDDNTLKSLELSEGQLEVHFRRLNLAHMRRIYQEVAVRAEKESWSYRDFLALLLAEEVARRKQTRLQRCTRSAHFPFFKTIDEFDFTLQSTLRESVMGSYLELDFVTEGRSLILHGKTGRGKTHLAVAIGYRAIQNGFETLFTTAAELIEDLSNASKRGHLQESLATYTHPHVLVIDEVGYLTYGPDAANVLFHVVNDRHLKKRPMIFTTNKPLSEWGKVLHDEDMAAAILDRVLERGRFIHLDGPSGRTRHLNLEDSLLPKTERVRISGIGGSEFPEPTNPALSAIFLLCSRHQIAQASPGKTYGRLDARRAHLRPGALGRRPTRDDGRHGAAYARGVSGSSSRTRESSENPTERNGRPWSPPNNTRRNHPHHHESRLLPPRRMAAYQADFCDCTHRSARNYCSEEQETGIGTSELPERPGEISLRRYSCRFSLDSHCNFTGRSFSEVSLSSSSRLFRAASPKSFSGALEIPPSREPSV